MEYGKSNEDELNSLQKAFSALGLELKVLYVLKDRNSSRIACSDTRNIGWASFKELQNALFSGSFHVDGKLLDNPFKGCKSIDELNVKIDLMGK